MKGPAGSPTDLSLAAETLRDHAKKAFQNANRPYERVYISDSSVPALAGEELAVSFDGIQPGYPAPTNVGQLLPAFHALFSVWATRESVIPDEPLGYDEQPTPAEIEAVAEAVIPDARVLLDAGLTALADLPCENAVVRSVTPLVANGGLVGNVMRIAIGIL